jgi:GntR family transcriptional regulator/MocR family aminotransferase
MAALERHLPILRVRGVSAGLHLYAELPLDADDAAIVTAAARHAVAVDTIPARRSADPPWASGALPSVATEVPVMSEPPALMLGYAALPERALEEAAALLAAAVAEARPSQ